MRLGTAAGQAKRATADGGGFDRGVLRKAAGHEQQEEVHDDGVAD